MNKIKEIIKAIPWQLGLCTLFIFGILIVSPTPITYFCAGWCLGLTVTSTIYIHHRNKKKDDEF